MSRITWGRTSVRAITTGMMISGKKIIFGMCVQGETQTDDIIWKKHGKFMAMAAHSVPTLEIHPRTTGGWRLHSINT
tara:strand:- start:10908 stop:11138 length:231 start_codon:yes stop_codon:yes gene_type:complete